MREMPFGADGVFNNEALLNRMNSDLANDLGNLVSRTVAMVEKYFDGIVPPCGTLEAVDLELREMAQSLPDRVEGHMNAFQFSLALSDIWQFIARSNKYIDQTAPWVLAKDAAQRERLGTVMYHLIESIRIVAALIAPVMPHTPAKICEQIGLADDNLLTFASVHTFGLYPAGNKVCKAEALFPRIDIARELDIIDSLTGQKKEATASAQEAAPEKKQPAAAKKQETAQADDCIGIDDFAKVQLRTARVVACEPVEGSEKLLKFTLDDGTGKPRTILSGIRKWYDDYAGLVGKDVVFVANLKPRKMMGMLSDGMLLSAEADDGNLSLLSLEHAVKSGSKIS